MTSPFMVVAPTLINDANFVSSTITEDDYDEYDELVTYDVEDRVIITTGVHKIYESLVDTNLDNYPPDSPASWVEVGPTNRWSAFDESGGTVSAGASPLEFVVTGDLINSIGLLEVVGSSIRIQAYNAGEGTYYDQTFMLEDAALIDDWYEYFYAEFLSSRQVVVTDIPAVDDSQYTITITGDSPSLGTFVMGRKSEFGFTEYNAKIGIIDYSRKEVDQFGKIILVRRAYSKRMDVSVICQNVAVDSIGRKLADLRATPALWIAAKSKFELLTIYGFYRDWSIDIAYPTESIASLQIEGLS